MAAAGNQPLTAAQAERFRQALGLLQAGQRARALSIAELMVAEAPRSADAWQLLGICLAGDGRHEPSDAAYERALQLAPGNVAVSRNYGASLARHGKALRAQSRFDAAETVLRRALALSPEQVSAWVDLGVVLRSLGRIDEALDALRRAERMLQQRGIQQPEVQDAINGVLADAGRLAEAVAGARALVASHSTYAPAHETLGRLLWENNGERAAGEDPLDGFVAAARAQPGNHRLQLACARTLLAARRADEALALLHPLRRREPGNAVLDWFAADALDALHRHDEAALLYASAARRGLEAMPDFLNAHARHAFRTRKFDLATACAEKVVRLDPRNQEGWSHLGTAWRLSNDEREHWLCDYDRLVDCVEVVPPAGGGSQVDFLQTLSSALAAMHNARREPLDQSVRGGTQTAGQLFGRNEPAIRSAEDALRVTVERWLRGLPEDAGHPFLSRRRRSVDFVGSWSVRLSSSGRHANHIHPRGWASSAFYVSLPPEVCEPRSPSRAGWLQLGQPLEDLGLDLPPRRFIQPRPGHLALFPSYLWHGTVPFDAGVPRLTIAFDMQPKE